MESKLDEEAAYQAMLVFLANYQRLGQSEGIGGLLGSMQLLDDGRPADPAIWDDWLEAVRLVSSQERMAS